MNFYALIVFLLFGTGLAKPQPDQDPLYESRFTEARDIKIHYRDFSGSGLPVVRLHL